MRVIPTVLPPFTRNPFACHVSHADLQALAARACEIGHEVARAYDGQNHVTYLRITDGERHWLYVAEGEVEL